MKDLKRTMNSEGLPAGVAAYTFGPFRLDLEQRQLLAADQPLTIAAKAYDTLVLLVDNRGRVVEKEEILSKVWPDSFVSEDSLTQVISLLRRTLGDDSTQPTYIATVPRRGYRFVAEVAEIRIEEAVPPEAAVPELPEPPVPAAIDTAAPVSAPPAIRSRFGWPALSVVGIAAAALLLLVARTALVAPKGAPTDSPIRFVQPMPDGVTLASPGVLSPDGRHLAFVGQDDATGIAHLWFRTLNLPNPRMIGGTEGAFRPFWSPDSQSIAFFADGKLKRVGIDGTPPQTLAPVGYRPSGGSWSSDGIIAFADRVSKLYAVPENGGDVVDLTELDASRNERGHSSPHFLPDGTHYLFYAESGDPAQSGTYIGTVGSSDRIKLLDGSSHQVTYARAGYVLYVRDDVLIAQRFDASTLRLTGAPMPMPSVNAAGEDGEVRVGSVSVSTNGLLTFGGTLPPNTLAWLSRDGRQISAIPGPPNQHNPVLSPDGRLLVADGNGGLWLTELDRGASTRVVSDGNLPAWSHDGSRLVFTARSGQTSDLYARPVNGANDDTLLVGSNEMKLAGNWSPDGRSFVYTSSNPHTRLDLWTVDDAGATAPFLRTASNEMQPQISPDGRWVAYASDESGVWEVYIQSFPTPGRKRIISTSGGAQPEWRHDGRELFYLSRDGMMMAVPMSRNGDELHAGKPGALFKAPVARDLIGLRNQYSVSADGTRFVVDVVRDRDPLTVVINWTSLVNP